MRAAVYGLLSEDVELRNLGVKRVYASPSIDTPKEEFFLVIRWLDSAAAFKMVGTRDLQVWVHKKDADYFAIGKVISRVKDLMTETFHRQGSDGMLRQAAWTGDSGDLRDDGFRTFTQHAGFRCNGGVNAEV